MKTTLEKFKFITICGLATCLFINNSHLTLSDDIIEEITEDNVIEEIQIEEDVIVNNNILDDNKQNMGNTSTNESDLLKTVEENRNNTFDFLNKNENLNSFNSNTIENLLNEEKNQKYKYTSDPNHKSYMLNKLNQNSESNNSTNSDDDEVIEDEHYRNKYGSVTQLNRTREFMDNDYMLVEDIREYYKDLIFCDNYENIIPIENRFMFTEYDAFFCGELDIFDKTDETERYNYIIGEAQRIVNECINEDMSDIQKYFELAKYVANNYTYGTVSPAQGQTIEEFLYYKKGVCNAYAYTYKLLCNIASLRCGVIHSDGHALNYIPDINNHDYIVDTCFGTDFLTPKTNIGTYNNYDWGFGKVMYLCDLKMIGDGLEDCTFVDIQRFYFSNYSGELLPESEIEGYYIQDPAKKYYDLTYNDITYNTYMDKYKAKKADYCKEYAEKNKDILTLAEYQLCNNSASLPERILGENINKIFYQDWKKLDYETWKKYAIDENPRYIEKGSGLKPSEDGYYHAEYTGDVFMDNCSSYKIGTKHFGSINNLY